MTRNRARAAGDDAKPRPAPDAAGTAVRALALDALVRIEAGAYSHLLLPTVLRDTELEPRDRAFVTELVAGTLRRRRLLDDLLSRVSRRRLPDLDPEVRNALRLGAHQLLAGVAPHAAVSTTVGALGPRTRGYVNGVLRALTRLGPPWPEPEGDDVAAIGVRTSHPDWIVERLFADLGEEDARRVLAADDEVPVVTLRVRAGVDGDAVTRALEADGVTVMPGAVVSDARRVRHTGEVGALTVVRDGRATPQDEGSQAVVDVVAPAPGERVLEVAAAPGGKATAIGERVARDGLVVALDLHPSRIERVTAAIDRLALAAVVAPVVADGRCLPVRADAFDAVLVDAPCSGLGVLRRRPEARWRVTADDATELAALQRDLLAAAAGAVRPGGRLVYSVCTLTREETIDVAAWFGERFPGLAPLPSPGPPWRPHGQGGLLLPGATDGMFVAAWRRSR